MRKIEIGTIDCDSCNAYDVEGLILPPTARCDSHWAVCRKCLILETKNLHRGLQALLEHFIAGGK